MLEEKIDYEERERMLREDSCIPLARNSKSKFSSQYRSVVIGYNPLGNAELKERVIRMFYDLNQENGIETPRFYRKNGSHISAGEIHGMWARFTKKYGSLYDMTKSL